MTLDEQYRPLMPIRVLIQSTKPLSGGDKRYAYHAMLMQYPVEAKGPDVNEAVGNALRRLDAYLDACKLNNAKAVCYALDVYQEAFDSSKKRVPFDPDHVIDARLGASLSRLFGTTAVQSIDVREAASVVAA